MRNSSGCLIFDLSCVIELLNFQELYNKFITKLKDLANSKCWMNFYFCGKLIIYVKGVYVERIETPCSQA